MPEMSPLFFGGEEVRSGAPLLFVRENLHPYAVSWYNYARDGCLTLGGCKRCGVACGYGR